MVRRGFLRKLKKKSFSNSRRKTPLAEREKLKIFLSPPKSEKNQNDLIKVMRICVKPIRINSGLILFQNSLGIGALYISNLLADVSDISAIIIITIIALIIAQFPNLFMAFLLTVQRG